MRSLIAVLFLALPLLAQEPAPKVVVVQPGAASRPAPPTKIVHVAPNPEPGPAGAFEGSRSQATWFYFTSRGPERNRAIHDIWRSRLRPVHPFRYAPVVYRGRLW
jgi:hypothetical protein